LFEGAFGGGEEEALGDFAAHGAGFEVGDDDDEAVDEVFGFVVVFEAGADLALLGAKVDFQHEEFVGVGVFAAFEDAGDAEVQPCEIIELHQRFRRTNFIHGYKPDLSEYCQMPATIILSANGGTSTGEATERGGGNSKKPCGRIDGLRDVGDRNPQVARICDVDAEVQKGQSRGVAPSSRGSDSAVR